ncbi:N-acetylmuramoyl-L-alanine amidase [Muricauda oceani]|jgi:N-acetylmuramoyl-L-alanine amidase|uniref:N-acetylmuramoyl-L-alanine amidase n=1 Tax=Flagellimonas oceani TaxID=2698672 RepID=A0A6G7IZB8_9FLAO|nr:MULTISPECIES: N-acetylmuramoyl-L-alanine amidase [Allomuricauda]MBW8244729.1 N-acetylmuramoyl-L-alanine amidase [Allomuricauda oceani]QII43664.1 N-acetylmuramoyl-L-alanine amidase [Allomuricauda oceani]
MKRRNTLLLLGIFTLLLPNTYGQRNSSHKPIIIIDPGHGGLDSGAIGVNGLSEKELTLKLAEAILRYNKVLLDNRYDMYLTRYSDTLISLGHRTRLAKVLQPDLFISLHCNHADNPKASGLEIYLYNRPISQSHISMAKAMEVYLKTTLGYRSRGVKRANFQVLRDNREVCPALLLELGFLSHSDEAGHLERKENISALGLAILMGIKKMME